MLVHLSRAQSRLGVSFCLPRLLVSRVAVLYALDMLALSYVIGYYQFPYV